MQNFQFEHDGKTLWFSRSLACAMLCYAFDSRGRLCVLVNQRGDENEFFPGMWNVPGGFIDFNETAKACAIRETYEETGVSLFSGEVEFFDLNTEPGNGRQTMIARFCCLLSDNADKIHTTSEHCEPGEVKTIRWIPCNRNELACYSWTKDQIVYILRGKRHIMKKHPLKYFWYKLIHM